MVVCPDHVHADPDYTQIGNNEIIELRNQKTIPSFGERTFRDSIAFYFGYPSIMLYNIKTGWGVPQKPQSEIIYLSYDICALAAHRYQFFYTDGQANKMPITRLFTDLADIAEVDLEIAHTKNFSPEYTDKNPDLKRRKHAEFHIFNEVAVDHFAEIIVYDAASLASVNGWIEASGRTITARVDQNYYF